MLRFPGLEGSGKRHRSWKTPEKSWHSKIVVLEILLPAPHLAGSPSGPRYDLHIIRRSAYLQ